MLIDKDSLEIICEQWHPGDDEWVAKASVPLDLTPLMPYVNAVARRPEFYTDVPAVVWIFEDRKVAMRPHEISVSHVVDSENAAKEVGKVVDWLNDLWERKDASRDGPLLETRVPWAGAVQHFMTFIRGYRRHGI